MATFRVLRNRIAAALSERPVFLNFTSGCFMPGRFQPSGTVRLIGMLQQQRDGKTWVGQLHIEPPQIDPPATLSLTLPDTADIRFAPEEAVQNNRRRPFPGSHAGLLQLFLQNRAFEQRLQVRCTGKTLSENPFECCRNGSSPAQRVL